MPRHTAAASHATMRFIVHADDCGLTREISEDIFDCLSHGPLNSVSVIMGGTHTAASLQRLAHMPHVRTCLHLNILEGRCTAPIAQVRALVSEAGIFRYGLGQMLAKLAAGTATSKKNLLSAIRTELEAQTDAFAAGFPQLYSRGGLHLDGHLHIHQHQGYVHGRGRFQPVQGFLSVGCHIGVNTTRHHQFHRNLLIDRVIFSQ